MALPDSQQGALCGKRGTPVKYATPGSPHASRLVLANWLGLRSINDPTRLGNILPNHFPRRGRVAAFLLLKGSVSRY